MGVAPGCVLLLCPAPRRSETVLVEAPGDRPPDPAAVLDDPDVADAVRRAWKRTRPCGGRDARGALRRRAHR